MIAKYYDPLFYISSSKMPFTIRIEINMKDGVNGESLEYAVRLATKRFSYFSLRVERKGEEYLVKQNDTPIPVISGDEVIPLGSKELNGHLTYLSYSKNQIRFFTSHVITDGGGFMPFVKTVLYYYCSNRYRVTLDCTGVELADSPVYSDELGNPYPESLMENAEPLYVKKCGEFFRLADGGNLCEEKNENGKVSGKVFRIKIPEKKLMEFSFDHDGSPNALISVLFTKAIWSLFPDVEKSVVCAVSFNIRSGLKNRHGFKMLSSSIALEYPKKLKNESVLKLCTLSRGMISIQSQEENVLYYAKKIKEDFGKIEALKTLDERKKYLGEKALKDCTENTFSVSYVGRSDLGESSKYIDSIYNVTDGSTHKTVFIEVTSVNGYFDIAFIQGFSSEKYFNAFLAQLVKCEIPYERKEVTTLNVPDIVLP